jgi:hypothetical protein
VHQCTRAEVREGLVNHGRLGDATIRIALWQGDRALDGRPQLRRTAPDDVLVTIDVD